MPLKGKQLVVYPCKTLWKALSIIHNHNPHVPQQVKTLVPFSGIEGGEDYAFANIEELFLAPNIIPPPKFKVLDFDKYKGTTCPKNHLKDVLSEDGGIGKR